MGYTTQEVFNNVKKVLSKKTLIMLSLLLIEAGISVLTYFVLKEHVNRLLALRNDVENYHSISEILAQIFTLKVILSIIISMITTFILTGITIYIVKQTIYPEKNDSINLPSRYGGLFIGYLAYLGSIFLGSIILGFLAIIPIIGFFALLGLIVFIFYISICYRFIPFVAFIEGSNYMFDRSKRYIKGHYGLSFSMLILGNLLGEGIDNLSKHMNQDIFIIIFIIIGILIIFFFRFFDIVFLITGYKHDKLRQNETVLESQENSDE